MVAVVSVRIPHFKFPLKLAPNGVSLTVVDQDSDDEIIDCIEVLLLTELGERIEDPDYGIPDGAFTENGINETALQAAIIRIEDRAELVLESDAIQDAVQRVRVRVQGREFGG